MAGVLNRLRRLPLKLCLVFGIVLGVGVAANPTPAQAGCCWCAPWAIVNIIASGQLLDQLRDQIVDWMTDYFNDMFTDMFRQSDENSGEALMNAGRSHDASIIASADNEGVNTFNSGVASAQAATSATSYAPSVSACTDNLARSRLHQASAIAAGKRGGLRNASNSYMSGSDPLTANGEISTLAKQYQRIATQFFDPSWNCPSGMTCGAVGPNATQNLNPNDAIFRNANYQIDQGSPNEIAAKLWVDLVSVPVPPTAVNGDQLALPAARTNMRISRGYTLAVNVQREVVNDVLAQRMVQPGVDGPSVTKRLYEDLADAELKATRSGQLASADKAAKIAAIGTEVDRMNYAYWQLFLRLEKMALMRALQIKAKLETESGVMDNNPLPASSLRAS